MNPIKFTITISLAIFFSLSSIAQERIYVKKKEFKVTEDGLSEAWKKVKKGNFLFYQHRPASYKKAIPFYKSAIAYNSENAELNLLIAICYLRSDPKSEALVHVQKAFDLKEDVHPKLGFFLGRALHHNLEFAKAIDEYNAYKESLSESRLKEQAPIIDKYIAECESGIKIKKKTARVIINNLGSNINSEFDDYGSILSADGSSMVFTSRRGVKGDRMNLIDNKYFEDIYTSNFVSGKWEEAVNIGKPVNSDWNDAVVSLSEDGQKLIFYRGRERDGDLYSATLKGDKWKNIHDLTHKLNKKKSQESAICFNADGTTAYIVSDLDKDSYGGKDIYYTMLDETGKKWSKPVNLGDIINSEYDEASVYITPDEKTIYFSSKGHNTIGGYDIFVSEYKYDSWTVPRNLGLPINSPDDDLFMSILMNGRDAYYATIRKEGKGGFDIYHATLLGPEKPLLLSNEDELIASIAIPVQESFIEESMQINYTQMTIVKGSVTDYNTGKPLGSTIELVDNKTGKLIKKATSNENTGSYLISLPSGKDYGFSVNADGYMFHSENFVVPEAQDYKEIFKDIQLQPMTPGSKIILHNTFFESGKSSLRPESFSELNRLAKMFEKYPNLILEISGHTDSRGSLAVNQRLSRARAKSVVDYIVGQGVNPANLKAMGYNYKFPVASNKTKEGRQENRRVEAKILSN
jgi:outer membrane protein OmpA-like peptidoglycan-associated protein/tetratricopeptide (TPR) repeat protein